MFAGSGGRHRLGEEEGSSYERHGGHCAGTGVDSPHVGQEGGSTAKLSLRALG